VAHHVEHPATNNGTDDADDNVTDDATRAFARNNKLGQKACDEADDEPR
jgi:hypothetical protein